MNEILVARKLSIVNEIIICLWWYTFLGGVFLKYRRDNCRIMTSFYVVSVQFSYKLIMILYWWWNPGNLNFES